MQKLLKIMFALVIIALIISSVFLYSIYYRVEHVRINYKTIYNEKVTESLNDLTIGFISDIRYNEFMNHERLERMLKKYQNTNTDVCIFGGDLFSERLLVDINEDTITTLTTLLKDIEAPLGKFANLGDCDTKDEKRKQLVEQILTDADFEIISNKLIQIRTSQHSDSLSLIGVDAYINNDVDISSYSSQLEKEKFHLLVTHCPDFIQQGTIEISNFDVILSGHSLGGQIYLPILGGMVHQEGATKYYHGAYQINQTKLYISNGLGTINIDMRLFAPPEIIILKLKQV